MDPMLALLTAAFVILGVEWGLMFTPGCGCCGCPGFTVTVNDVCSAAHISGASVTIGSDTQTTNGSGVATFTTAAKGASITITATGFCDGSSTVPTNCAARTVTLYPTTITLSLAAELTCPGALGGGCSLPLLLCCPTEDFPVTVTVNQTQGGALGDSITLDSCAAGTMSIPAPCPNSGTDYIFEVTWECDGFDTDTTTVTLPNSSASWLCSASSSITLFTPDTYWLFPNSECVGEPPASLTVTLVNSPLGACPSGTYTVNLISVNGCGCGATYQGVFTDICLSTPTPNTFTLTVTIYQDPDNPCACIGSIFQSGCAGLCPNVFTAPDFSLAGTFCCPVAFTATKLDCDAPFGTTDCKATVSE